jgi:anti-sigma factor RsiW
MKCEKFKSCAQRYREASLPARLLSACEEHLKTCPQCAGYAAGADAIKSLFAEIPVPPVPRGLSADIMRRVRMAAHDHKNAGNALVQWWMDAAVPARVAFAAALCAVVAAGVLAGGDLWNAPDSRAFARSIEFEAFSEPQKGSLEEAYLKLTQAPQPGDKK